jgi:hypothetical protein
MLASGFYPELGMKTIKYVLLAFLLAFLCPIGSFASTKDEKCVDPCGKPTPWDEFNVFELKVTSPEHAGYQLWRGRFDKSSKDIQISVESSDAKGTAKGMILLIGGRVMAIQGPIIQKGYEIDALDAPVLHFELIQRLLGRAYPGGPDNIAGEKQIDVSDERTGIKMATPSAEWFIAPP